MHETAVVRDLLSRAQAEVEEPTDIVALTLRIGPLSGITPESLRQCVDRVSHQLWGHRPALEIEESHDLTSPNALGVALVSIRLET